MTFIIHALGRSRTAWLSKYLTYGDYTCGHEQAVTMRTVEDYKKYFSNPFQGSAETGVAQGWRLIQHASPGIKTVVVRRPLEEIVDSFMAIDFQGLFYYDRDKLFKHLAYGQRMLEEISNFPRVLTVQFHDLNKEEVAKSVFEHCLPYKFDADWFLALKDVNIQMDVKQHILYYHLNKDLITNFKKECKRELIHLRRSEPDNILWKRYK